MKVGDRPRPTERARQGGREGGRGPPRRGLRTALKEGLPQPAACVRVLVAALLADLLASRFNDVTKACRKMICVTIPKRSDKNICTLLLWEMGNG